MHVECQLQSAELWSKFHHFGTEMIITKTGRYDVLIHLFEITKLVKFYIYV